MITIANGIILKDSTLTPLKENILIDDGKIIEISKDILEGEIIDASNSIVAPTLINSHTHIGDSIIKDEGYGLSFDEVVKPPNGIKHLALENAEDIDIINAMKESLNEMVQSGTSHFIDYREGGLKGVKLLKEASKDIPIKPIILARDNLFHENDPDLKKVKIAIRKLLKVADGIAPSGFGEISQEVANLITEECFKNNKISSIHVAETVKAQNNSISKHQHSEVELAIKNNFNQLVHFTNPINNDLNLINKNTNITICPRANSALSCGIPPLEKLLNKNLSLSIGTDNVMVNSPNMFRELEFTFKTMLNSSNNYINSKNILKLAMNNSLIKNKSFIKEGNFCEIFISTRLSKNPYLSIINRCETKHIINIINKDTIINK
ncbi:amidohydrolase family protein [Methanobrevibacter sp. DSM 116169]|uniref:amidohydrolase family protein n=1 Tax=Methanobrevibacter sp. DSM 116169 TaxID=3242727 RepID=UPI0038FCEB99